MTATTAEPATEPRAEPDGAGWAPAVASAATVLAAALVLFRIGEKSLWYDEAFSTGIVDRPFGDALWRMAHWEVNQSPFYLLLSGWWQISRSETFLRLLPAVFAVAAVPAMYHLGRRLAGARAGAIAAVLLACHPLVVQWGQQVRGYSLVLLLTILSSTLLLRALEEPRAAGRATAFALVAALATYAHFYAGLVVAAHGVWLLLRRPVPVRLLAVAGATYGALVTPLAAFLLTREGDPLYWVGDDGTASAVVETARELTGGTRWGVVPYVLAVLAGAWAARRARSRPAESGLALAAVWLLGPLAVVVLSTLTVKPLLEARFLIVVVPALVLLAAAGVERLGRRAGTLLLVVLLGVSALGLENWYTTPSHEDWRTATRLVSEAAGSGGAVVVEPWRGVFALRYYEDRLGIAPHDVLRPTRADPPTGDQVVEILVLSGAGSSPRLDPGYLAWRDEHYEPGAELTVDGLAIRTYERR